MPSHVIGAAGGHFVYLDESSQRLIAAGADDGYQLGTLFVVDSFGFPETLNQTDYTTGVKPTLTLVDVPDGATIVDVEAGLESTCVLLSSGTITCVRPHHFTCSSSALFGFHIAFTASCRELL